MKLISESEIARLTERDRRTVASLLEGIESQAGPRGAKLYKSNEALQAIYGNKTGSTLDAAKIRLAEEQANLAKTRNECLRKERIPIEIPLMAADAQLQSFSAVLKARLDKLVPRKTINEILEALRGKEVSNAIYKWLGRKVTLTYLDGQ